MDFHASHEPRIGEPVSSGAPADGSPHDEALAEASEAGGFPSPATAPQTRAAAPAPAAPDAGPEPGASAVDRQAALQALRNLEATEARLQRNARRDAEETRGKLVSELLPVLDNLDRTIHAAHAAHGGRGDPALLEGVQLVRRQLEGVLRGYGVERVEALGQRFDPSVHEAIGMIGVSDPQRHGVVVQQVEPGYRFGHRLLRAARVNVGKLVSPYETRPVSMWR